MKNFYLLFFIAVYCCNAFAHEGILLPSATISGGTTVCQNSTAPIITFTGSGGQAPYTFTYNINSGTALTISTIVGNNTVTLNAPTGTAGTFTYNLVSVKDNTNATQPLTSSTTVVVNTPPIIDFTFTNNNSCSGTNIQFNSTVTGSGTYTYSWDFGDSTALSTQANPTHIFNSLGCGTATFNVTLTITGGGCTVIKTNTVTVKQKPDISFGDVNATGASNQFNNCQNASAANPSYSITVENYSTATCILSYSINWGDGNSQNNISFPISHTYNSLGAYNMIITALNSNNCSNSKIYIVKNISNPSAGINSPGSTQNLCLPTAPIQFSISNWGSNSPGTTYKIDFGDNTILNLTQSQLESSTFYNPTNPSLSSNYPVPHSYITSSCPNSQFTVTLTVENACGSTIGTIANISTINNPTANFTSPIKSCLTTNVLFNNTSTPGYDSNCDTSTKYIWNFGDPTGANNIINTGYTTAIPNANHTFSSFGTYTITLSAQNSCGITTKTQTICIEPPITPSFTLNTNSGCIPLAITTNNTTSPTDQCTTPTYLWNVAYAAANCGTTSAYTYTGGTSANSTSPSFNFTEAGTYTIKLTASNSCSPPLTTSQVVTVKKPPTVSLSNISNLCQSAVLTPVSNVSSCTNTTPTYLWSFPGGTPSSATTSTPPSVSYATTGNYTISLAVTNECGTTTATSNNFTVSSIPIVQNEIATICSATAFLVTPSTTTLGNNIPVGTTYSWNTPIVTGGITGGSSGVNQTAIGGTLVNSSSSSQTATYTVTPKLGTCSGATFTVVITVNPAPILTTQPASSTVCQGGTPTVLSVVLNNTSGSPSYQWYSNSVNNSTTGTAISGETNANYTPPSATTGTTYYYCIITLASGGCSVIKSSIATVTIATSATISQPIATQNLCVGTTITSPLTVTTSGGAGTPIYQWYFNTTNSNTGGTLISGATTSSYTPPVFNLVGTFYYYAIVNYANGCGNLTSNTAEIIIFNDPTIATQPITTQTLCQTATPTNLEVIPNGSATFSYQWYSNNSNNTTSGTIILGAINSTYTPPTTTVGTKYYYCLITQNGISGCAVASTSSAVIITVSPSFTSQPISSTICLGQTLTQLSVTSNNASVSASYQWYSNTSNSTSGAISIASANSSSYTPPATAIGTIYYYCVITFPSLSGGCSVITSNIAQITINPKPIITNQTTTICSNATFTITPSNSSSDIVPIGTTYTWSNPTISPIGSITGASAQSAPQNTISQTLINTITVPATVIYIVTPTTGTCMGATFTITVTVNPSTNPNAIKTDITCFGINNGSITTNITGGIPFTTGAPYSISWTGPNSFTSSSANINNLSPGIYNLSISDAGGCPISNNYTITEPSDINITTDSNNNITCFGSNNGNIAISVTGGTGAYTYSWTKNTLPFAATDDINNLAPATYVISVSDANNCGPKTASFTITEPAILSVSLVNQTNIDCYGFATGSIVVNVSGGTPIQTSPGVFDYAFVWSGPNGFTSSTQNISNLFAGVYTLTVTDNLGCTKNLVVTLTQSTEIIINATTTPIVCYGDNNATISVSLSGGHAPYQIQWSNLAVGLNQNNLAPGNYTITVTDNIGCQKTLTINIPSPPIFTVNPVVTNISCFGAHDGSIILNFVGGIAPVNLVWSDGSPAGITRNNLGPGTYSVIITDSKPCIISASFTIIEPQNLTLSAIVTDALNCSNANSGNINLLVSGGTPPFNYSWNNGTTTEDLTNITAGNYLVSVTDSRGCSKTAQYIINRPNPLTLSVTTTTNSDCDSHTVKQIFEALATNGVPPYNYSWSSGMVSGTNNEIMTTTQDGLITLTVTDAIGCSATYSLNVSIPVLGNPTFTSSSIGNTNYGIYSILDPIQFTSVVNGNYTSILWNFGDGTFSNELNPVHTYQIPNEYYLVTQTITYPFGCVYINHLALNIEKGYLLILPTGFTPNNNDGINDTLRPVTKGLKNIHLDIYDTWGSLIYSETGDTIMGWNGKIKGISSENGNYYAKVSAETFYGTIINENQTFVLIK